MLNYERPQMEILPQDTLDILTSSSGIDLPDLPIEGQEI